MMHQADWVYLKHLIMHCILHVLLSDNPSTGQPPRLAATVKLAVCRCCVSCMTATCSVFTVKTQPTVCIACLQEEQAGLVPEAGLRLPAGGPCCRCWPPLPQVNPVRLVQCYDCHHGLEGLTTELTRVCIGVIYFERLHSLCMVVLFNFIDSMRLGH